MENQLKEIIASVFGLNMDDVHENISSDDVEKWDSLHHMNLVAALEETYDVEFDEEEMIQLTNYKLILFTLQEKIES